MEKLQSNKHLSRKGNNQSHFPEQNPVNKFFIKFKNRLMGILSNKLDVVDLCKVDFIGDGILQVTVFDNLEFTDLEIEFIINYLTGITNGKSHKVLLTTGPFSIITLSGLQALSDEKAAVYVTANAYVITSISQKLIANFYLSTSRPKIPVKFFDKIEDAKAWLKTL